MFYISYFAHVNVHVLFDQKRLDGLCVLVAPTLIVLRHVTGRIDTEFVVVDAFVFVDVFEVVALAVLLTLCVL